MKRILVMALLLLGAVPGYAQIGPTIEAVLLKNIRAPRDVSDLSFSPSNKLLAAGGKGYVTAWNDQGQAVLSISIKDTPPTENLGDPIRAPVSNDPWVRRLLFSPDSKVLTVACVESDVRVYDVEQEKLLYSVYGNGRGGADCMAFSHDGKLLVTGGHDKLVALYDARAGKLIRTLDGHLYNVVAVAFTADDKQIVSVGAQHVGPDNAEVRFWNTGTGELVDNRTLSDLAPEVVELSRDGRIIAGNTTVNYGPNISSVILWNAATGESVRKSSRVAWLPTKIRLSPDNQVLMGWVHNSYELFRNWSNYTYLWSVRTGERYEIRVSGTTPDAKDGPEPGARALSPNNSTLAVHLSNGVIQIWDVSQFR